MVKASARQENFKHFKLLFVRIKIENVTVSGYGSDEELAKSFEKLFFRNLEGLSESARTSRIEAIETAADIRWPGIAELLKTRLPAEITREKSSQIRKKMEQLVQP